MSDGHPARSAKASVARQMLSEGSLYVYLVPRKPGVSLPWHLVHLDYVALHFGYNMEIPIPDLKVCDESISGTLNFRRRGLYACVVPWTSVFALAGPDKTGLVWDADAPPSAKKNVRPRLRLIRGGAQ